VPWVCRARTPAPMAETATAGELVAKRGERLLTAADFQGLAAVPPEVEWFANLGNKATRRAYQNALQDFMRFTGVAKPEEFRIVTRAHVIAWRPLRYGIDSQRSHHCSSTCVTRTPSPTTR
jgi:hypothetical protein